MIVIDKDSNGNIQVTEEGVTETLFPNIDDIGGSGSEWFDFSTGDFFAIFDKYATNRGMTKIELSFDTDQTAPITIQHSLGRVPKEMLIYPKNPQKITTKIQGGWVVEGSWAKDNSGNRTYHIANNPWFPVRKDMMSFVINVYTTMYNLTVTEPTDTEVYLRFGTTADTKLLAGEYVIGIV